MVKLARKHGVESLLPFTVKGTESKLRKRLEGGLRVKGTGVGERVKGKIEERTLKSRYAFLVVCLVGGMAIEGWLYTWKERRRMRLRFWWHHLRNKC